MPPSVLAATTDLFLQSRISEIAKAQGFEAKFVKGDEMIQAVKESSPRLVVLDLSSNDDAPFTIAEALKASSPSLKIFGFYPHVRTELKARAESSGIDYVVPNSSFTRSLKNILASQKVTG